MHYSIHEHRHRSSSWAAGRAARVKGSRMSGAQAKAIIEAAGLTGLLAGPDTLPPPQEFDRAQRRWRGRVIKAAGARGMRLTHGVVAKLVNVYL